MTAGARMSKDPEKEEEEEGGGPFTYVVTPHAHTMACGA